MPDYVATGTELPQTAIARWDANIDAIRVLKRLQAEGRAATPEEQKVLAKYSGFGDSAYEQAFAYYQRDSAWKKRKEELEELVTPEEHDAIKRSRLNAFYTTPEVIRSMWSGLRDLGADKLPRPKVLEPSAGSGRFLAYQPRDMAASSERTAVELDNLTAGLLKGQFPDATVYNVGFEAAPVPDGHFDIAVSNVPFGNYGVHDPEYLAEGKNYLTGSIHNYFFAKSMDKLRPGGVLAFITTHHTMDAPKARKVREYLADKADLVGAVRLPEDAFPDTEVVTDIIYLRKRAPGEPPGDRTWVSTQPLEVPDARGGTHTHSVNSYYLQNPDMVLGRQTAEGTMYAGQSYTVKHDPDSAPVPDKLAAATSRVSASPLKLDPATAAAPSSGQRRSRAAGHQETVNVWAERVEAETGDTERPRRLAELANTTRRLLNAEKGRIDDDPEQIRAELNSQYQDYVDAHKRLNHKSNRDLLKGMVDESLLMALENHDPDTKKWERSSIFSRRLARDNPERHVTNAADAMSVVLNESGALDFERMGQLLGQDASAVRNSLAKDRLIFRNPMGSWETANEYLTGRVRDKLEVARRVAGNNPAFQVNVAALEQVQPEPVPASDIETPLGAPWIPDDVVNDWVKQNLASSRFGQPDRWFRYNPESGEWGYNKKVSGYEAVMRSQWGTEGMAADKILEAVLKGTPISVTMPNPDGEGRVRDPAATEAAQQKARQMQDSFSEWIWQDADREERLVKRYNELHNSTRPRVFDGSHLTFPGMSPKWAERMRQRQHQMDASFRVVSDGTALLAHEVGFGKTAVMISSAMERQRLGLIDKPVFVVPKATHEQFASDFREMYPGATLLAPSPSEFSKKNREAFLNRAATGDWDGVVLTTNQFQSIPVKPETEARWVEAQIADLEAALSAANEENETSRESQTQKQIQKKLEREQKRLKDLRAQISAGADKGVVYFEDLGIDQLYVDEADQYKNLPFATKMGQVKGLPNSESKRAWDMFLKTQHIQGLAESQSGSYAGRGGVVFAARPSDFADNGVVFATGTPISNTIAEAWTMMRYLQLPELRRQGLQHFDAWAKTYGKITMGMEQTPQGKYRNTQRFAKFVNLPELSRLFQNVADVRVASEVPEMVAVRPRLVDARGNPKRTGIKAPNYPFLEAYMEHLRDRVDKLPEKQPEEDNMLLISSDARKASLDIRMVWPEAEPNPNGKVQLAASKIAEIHKAEEADKGTQLVFLDLGTPKASDKPKEGDDDSEEEGGEGLTAEESKIVNNVYGILKRELVRRGVPEKDIAFVQDHKTRDARKKLFDNVRSGDVRVLIGSTETVGVGVNVQDRAAALHHLDVPWRPRDIEQREGRIIRQGNKVYGPRIEEETGEVVNPGRGVQIYQYVQEGSFDEFMWQAVEVKGQAVKALMKRNITARSMDDADPLVLSAAEAKALASGNPMVLRAEQIKNQINTLRLERAAHRNQQENARGQIRRLETMIEAHRERLPILEVDAQHALENDGEDKLRVSGQPIEKRADAGKAIETRLSRLNVGDVTGIGTYKGFDVSAANSDRGYQLAVTNPATKIPYSSAYIEEVNPAGLMSRLDNLVNGIPRSLESSRDLLNQHETSLELYREQAGKPFEGTPELAKKERHLAYVQALLSDAKDAVRPPDFDEDPSGTVEYDTPELEAETAAPGPAATQPGPETVAVAEAPVAGPSPVDDAPAQPETAAVAADVATPEPEAVAEPSPVDDAPAEPETAAVAADVATPEPEAVAEPSPVDDAPAEPETAAAAEAVAQQEPETVAEPSPVDDYPAEPETAAVAEAVAQQEPETVAEPSPVDDYPAQPETAAVAEDAPARSQENTAPYIPPYDPAIDDAPVSPEQEEAERLARDTRLAAMREEKRANNEQLKEWALGKLAQGQDLLFQTEGIGPAVILRAKVVADWQSKGHQPILVGSEGNLRILGGQRQGRPKYDTVLSGGIVSGDGQHMIINKPMPETPEPSGEVAEPTPIEEAKVQTETAAVAEDVATPESEAVTEPSPVQDYPAEPETAAVAADDAQVEPVTERPPSVEPEKKQSSVMGLHITRNPDGTWGFAGSIPDELAFRQYDGSPLTEEQAASVQETSPLSVPGVRIAKFETEAEALAAASDAGYAEVWRSGDIVSTTPDTPPPSERQLGKLPPASLTEEQKLAFYRGDIYPVVTPRRGDPDAVVMDPADESWLEAVSLKYKGVLDRPDSKSVDVGRALSWFHRAGIDHSEIPSYQDHAPSEVEKDARTQDERRESPEPTESETEELVEQVMAVKDDGHISPEEAEDTASAAGKLLQKAEEETPDPPSVTRTYENARELDALLEELCDDPEELAALRERVAQAQARSEHQARAKGEEPDEVPAEVRRVAGEILAAKEQATPDGPKEKGRPRRVREEDAELLARVEEECDEDTLAQGQEQADGQNGKAPLPMRKPKARTGGDESKDREQDQDKEPVPVLAKKPITPIKERCPEERENIRKELQREIAVADASAETAERRRRVKGHKGSVGIVSPAPGPGRIGGKVKRTRYGNRTTADRFMRTRKVKSR